MKAPEILFWIVIGALVGALLILVANEMLINVLKINVEYEISKSFSGGGGPSTCSDGTLYGECSSTKPKYCSSGTLIDRCSLCGCPPGYDCQADESCLEQCTCDEWSDVGCGLNGCANDEQYQTRTCDPSGCDVTSRCVYTDSCVNTCSDGTLYGECSSNKPKYCDNGNLIDRCSLCGCPPGYDCQADESCESSSGTHIGLNYQARADFDPSYLTDAEMQRDLDLFAENDVTHITCIVYWTSLEPNMGSYSTVYLNRVERFIDYAISRGFKVSIDTHVHMLGNGAPAWFSDYGNGQHDMTNVFSEPMRTRWIELHGYLAQRWGDKVYSIQSWNEPYVRSDAVEPSDADNPEAFVQLFNELRQAWKEHSDALFSIRTAIYGLNQFWNYEDFYNAVDYVSINIYPNRYSGHTYSNLFTAIEKVQAHGKDYWIGEIGYDNTNEIQQAQGLENLIISFQDNILDAGYPLPKVIQFWIWLRATTGNQWSLCRANGDPKPSFFELEHVNLG